MNYWLMKSEPGVFGIADLARAPHSRTLWDGVRNYQARNYLRTMRRGDRAFFYHSNCTEPGIAGTMHIVSEAAPDPTQFDPLDPHYDPKSTREAPRWSVVEVEFEERFLSPVSLQRLRVHDELSDLVILRRGNRLSVTPIESAQWEYVIEMSRVQVQK